jgi:hypothetical protein
MNDYCIVMIGDEDFSKTKDYVNLIYYIRDTLQQIKHTNIIICLSTYKVGNFYGMFNWRVETFNKLLYLDVMTHGHANLLDSNEKLDYDFNMFKRYFGTINHYGMNTIFQNLQDLIIAFEDEGQSTCDGMPVSDFESLFFRD